MSLNVLLGSQALAKCRTVLDLYSQLLGENTYFFTMYVTLHHSLSNKF